VPGSRKAAIPGAEQAFEARLRVEIDRRTAATPAMLHSINEAGRLISVSDAWLAKLGYSREEVLGRLSTDFLTPESRERAIKQIVPEFFRVGRCENIHYQMVKKDGGVIDVLVSAVLTDDPAGRGRVSLAVVTDITALLEARRRMRESEARYRSLVEGQSELVSLAAPDGVLSYVNHAYASFYGRGPEEMVGRNLFEFVPEDEHAALAAHFRRVCATRESLEDENQVILPGGEKRWFAWTNRALTDEQGRIAAIHSVGRDIQERVVAERQLQASEARYRFLAENSNDMILLVDPGGKRIYASPASRKLLGYEPEETIAMRLQEAIHPDDAPRVLAILAAQPGDTTLTYRMRRKDGGYIWVETTGKTVEVADGKRQRLIIVRDVEQRVAAEQRLTASEARYRLLADNSTDMVFQLDQDLVRRYVSPACREILGFEPEELVGVRPADMAHPDDAPRIALAFDCLMRGETETLSIINRIRHKDGRWIWVEARLRALNDPETGKPKGIIGALRDISVRKAIEDELADANRRLQALAGQDALTGLANRRAFDEALAREYRCARQDDSSLAMIMIDVDHFKAFNDLYGHPAGDNCLKLIAKAISKTVRRQADVAARYGGEEFGIVLPRTDEAGAVAIAGRIQQAVLRLKLEHKGDDRGLVTISAGAAATQPATSAETPEFLVREADRALYLAKKSGRNTIVLASGADLVFAEAAGPIVSLRPSRARA
jgi:diguanylate cyclase (GGDEF)-like protein/PAS domain S-box-containing protein